jgi:hypothetical protein
MRATVAGGPGAPGVVHYARSTEQDSPDEGIPRVAERDADAIQRDIEQARVTLARAVDQIAYRTNPKRVSESVRETVLAKAQSPAGKAVLAGTGLLVALLIVRRVRKH